MILWRAIALLSLLLGVCLCADTLRHDEFDSGVVGTTSSPRYFVRCEGLEFGRDATVASIRLYDESPFPQFQPYRQNSSRGPAPYLYIPAAYGTAAGWLRFVRFDVPNLVLNPKPNNDIHEAVLRVRFEPIGKLRNDPLDIDRVYLGFPGFRPFAVRRVAPVSQSQNPLVALHNAVVGGISPQAAMALLVIGAFVFCGIVADSYRQREVFVYRWKLKQLESKGGRMGTRKQVNAEGDVLVPPKWDEGLIAMQFRNLAHRPAMLGVFVSSVRDRFILNQDEKTSAIRIRYLRTKLEELKVGKELQREIDDLEFRETDLEIRRLEQELKKSDLAHQVKIRAELRGAEHKRDILRVKLEQEQIGKEIRDLKKRPNPPPSPEARKQELYEKIQRQRERKAYVRQTVVDADERAREENRCDDRIAQLQEELDALS